MTAKKRKRRKPQREREPALVIGARATCKYCEWERVATTERERHLARQNAAIHAQRKHHDVIWTEERLFKGLKP